MIAKIKGENPLSVNLVRKLAAATDFSRTLIGVEESDTGPAVWGIFSPGSDWTRFQRAEQTSGTSLPMAIVVKVTAPGSLELGFSDGRIWSTHRGEPAKRSFNVLKSGPVHDFFDPAIRTSLEALFPHLHHADITSERFFQISYGSAYRRLLVRVLAIAEEAGHGSTVLFLRSPDSRAAHERLDIKYPTPDLQLRSIVESEMSATFDQIEKWKSLRTTESISREELDHWRREEAEREKHAWRLLDAAQFIGRLTQVDGAVVITDELQVIGFGAVVRDLTRCPEYYEECLDERATATQPVHSEIHGSRHRSAMSFCSGVDSVAFVLSEDGGVKAVKQVDNRLCVWPSVSLAPESWFVTAQDLIPELAR